MTIPLKVWIFLFINLSLCLFTEGIPHHVGKESGMQTSKINSNRETRSFLADVKKLLDGVEKSGNSSQNDGIGGLAIAHGADGGGTAIGLGGPFFGTGVGVGGKGGGTGVGTGGKEGGMGIGISG